MTDEDHKIRRMLKLNKPNWVHPVESTEAFDYLGFDFFVAKAKNRDIFYWVAFDAFGGTEDSVCANRETAIKQAKNMIQGSFVDE